MKISGSPSLACVCVFNKNMAKHDSIVLSINVPNKLEMKMKKKRKKNFYDYNVPMLYVCVWKRGKNACMQKERHPFNIAFFCC